MICQYFGRESTASFCYVDDGNSLVASPGSVWKDFTLTCDAENRLTAVSGLVTANFKYDGGAGFAGAGSQRVRATINGGNNTEFIGNQFE